MSYLDDDVPTQPWSRRTALVERDPAETTVVTKVPWFLQHEVAALDPNNKPTRARPDARRPARPARPAVELQAEPRLLTFEVGSDPLAPDSSSAAVAARRAVRSRVRGTFISGLAGFGRRRHGTKTRM